MRTKVCTVCERRLPLDETHFAFRRKSDGTFRADCKSCYNAKKKKFIVAIPHGQTARGKKQEESRRRNRAIIASYIKEHPCLDCGESDPIVLQFDHVRGTKVRNVSHMVRCGHSEVALMDEINKCDVVCANCHTRRTANRSNWKKLSD